MTIKKTITFIAVLAFSSMSSLHIWAFEELGKIKIATVEAPSSTKTGVEEHWLKNGKEISYKTLSVENGVVTGIGSNGCKYTSLDNTWGPSLSWEDCDGSKGSHKIHKQKGSPWPMQVKKKFSFSFTGSDSKGGSWRGYRKCKVKQAVKVSVPAGEFDTFKIVCSVDWETKTYWYSPELGHSVAIKKKSKGQSSSRSYFMEFVKVETL